MLFSLCFGHSPGFSQAETRNVTVLCFSVVSFFAPTRLMPDLWGKILNSEVVFYHPVGKWSPTDLHLAQLVWPAGTWTQLHWQPVLTDYFLPLHPLEERQRGQSVLSQSRFLDWKDKTQLLWVSMALPMLFSSLFCSPEFIYPQYGNWQQMPLLPILTLLLLTLAHCARPPGPASYPWSFLSSLTSHGFYFNHVFSFNEVTDCSVSVRVCRCIPTAFKLLPGPPPNKQCT